MAFWKKQLNKSKKVYYPQAIVKGKPVETEDIAKELARISTVSNSDVQAVLGGLGYFRYTLNTVGVADLKDFDFQKQVKAVRVEFTPDREKTSSGTYTRALVDSGTLEWIELPSDTVDDGPSGGGDGGIEENPLG